MAFFCPECGNLTYPDDVRCGNCRALLVEGEGWEEPAAPSWEPEVLEKARDDVPYFPYEPREGQIGMVSDMVSALDSGRHIVAESGTGTGKTVVSLAAALQHAKSRGKKILYLTRTISQTDQVMRELRAISKLKPVTGVALTGRKKSCLLIRGREGYEDISPKALATICEESKENAMQRKPNACPYFTRIIARIDEITDYCVKETPSSGDLDAMCENLGVCPYEIKKTLMKDTDVVAAPYVHILSEDIRTNLLSNLDTDGDGILLVVDEAHNLIDAARDQESYSIGMRTIDSAIDEANAMKPVRVSGAVLLSDYLRALKLAVKSAATEFVGLGKTEAALPSGYVEGRMKTALGLTDKGLNDATQQVLQAGLTRTEMLMEKGMEEMSQIHILGEDMVRWVRDGGNGAVKIIEIGEKNETLRSACIDPKEITDFLRSLKGAIHMSGTLEPLDQYVKVMGLPADTVKARYPSPFPPENKLVVYVEDVTTKYDIMQSNPAMFTKIVRNIVRLCGATDENTLVLFTSYGMMERARPFLERDVKKTLYWEESGRPAATMRSLNAFRAGRNGVFFSVMGGSVAEGMDFPGDELGMAIIVGIPYPPPTVESKAMSDMFDAKYGPWTGWNYVSQVPATRKIKQAIGRLIRTETDRGMAIILDNRVSRYRKELGAKPAKDAVAEAKSFFEG